jgi:hypothetical protein
MAGVVLSGARAILKLAGKKVAFATGVTANEGIDYEPFRPLDELRVVEFVEVAYNVSLSADLVVAVGSSPTQQGFFPHTDLLSILNQPELIMELYDNVSSQPIFIAQGVKPSTNNKTIRAGQISANDMSFVAKVLLDTSEVNPGVTPGSGLPPQ